MLKVTLFTSLALLMFASIDLLAQKKEKLNIVCDGNSLTYGQGVPVEMSYPALLQKLFNKDSASGVTAAVHNMGVNGQTTPEMLFSMNKRLQEAFDPGADRNIVVAWEIRNHLVRHCTDRLAALNAYMTYCRRATELGYEVYAVTLLPTWSSVYCGDSSAAALHKLEDDRNFVNRYLNKNHYDFSYGIIDVTSLSTIGIKGANLPDGYVFSTDKPSATAYYLDGTHLNAEGNREIAEFVKKIIMNDSLLKTGYSFDADD